VKRHAIVASRLAPLLWAAAFATLIWALLQASEFRVGASLNSSQPYPTGWMDLAPEHLAIEALKLIVLAIASWLLLVILVSVLLSSTGHVRAASHVLRLMPRAMQAAIRPALAITLTTSMLLPSVTAAGANEAGTHPPEAVLIHLGSTVAQPETPRSPEHPQPPGLPQSPEVPGSPDTPRTPDTIPSHDPTPARDDGPTPRPSQATQPGTLSEAPPGPNIAELTHLDGRSELGADGQGDKAAEGRGEPVDESASQAGSDPRSSASIWIVEPGDHLWSISEQLVAANTDRPASDAEVGRYWLRLIETNRSSLPDPTNPDLIYPGMRLRLPAGSAAGLGLDPTGNSSKPS